MTEFVSLKDANVTSGPSGNRIYLVCPEHPDTDQALMLGKRLDAEYHRPPSATEIRQWFERHAKCSSGPDNFQLAYAKPMNWDWKAPNLVTEAVKLELVKS